MREFMWRNVLWHMQEFVPRHVCGLQMTNLDGTEAMEPAGHQMMPSSRACVSSWGRLWTESLA